MSSTEQDDSQVRCANQTKHLNQWRSAQTIVRSDNVPRILLDTRLNEEHSNNLL